MVHAGLSAIAEFLVTICIMRLTEKFGGWYSAKSNFVAKQNLRQKFDYIPTFMAKLLLFKSDAIFAYMSLLKNTQVISKYCKLEYWNRPTLSQQCIFLLSQKTANIHCMLNILMSRSNHQFHIDEINESVTEKFKNHSCSLFSVHSELSKYA